MSPGPRILIVDDELANRRLLEAILIDEGYQVAEASSGAEALAIITSGPVDLVLLDVMMPGLTGFEVCRRIRGELGLPHLPVVFVTALGDRRSRIQGKEVGADDFLTKPVDDVELVVRVASLLRLKAYHDARARERHLMATILDSMDEGVVAVERGAFVLHNRAAERILGPIAGWPALASWPGPHEVIGADGRVEPGVEAPLARAFAGAEVTEVVMRLPSTGVDGAAYLRLGARPLPEVTGAVAVFRDISNLVALDHFRQDMISLVVHDLKNMMTVIQANLEFCLEDDAVAPADARQSQLDAADASRRALRLISNLLDMARLEDSQLQQALTLAPVALADLCAAVALHRTSQLRAGQQTLTLELGDQVVVADAELLARVIENVLDNALRYTPRGGRLAIAATAHGDRVRLAIGNTGPPIPPEQRARIFEKYGQLSPTRRNRNLGLGLYFCQLVAVAHGGAMWVDETAEFPTVFVIELPAAAAAVVATGGAASAARLAG